MGLIDKELFRDELFRHYELLKVDDYEVWAVVDVDEVLDNIEEVKAIPIEWIDRWTKQFWKEINGTRYYMGDGYDIVWDMLEAWEEENGKE